MASACLPQMFKAVEIDGEAYWDGGYMGNPPIFPLIDETDARNIMIIQVNPLVREDIPKTPYEIQNRLNEITFNASLHKELRAIGFLWEIIKHEDTKRDAYRDGCLHRIHAVVLCCAVLTYGGVSLFVVAFAIFPIAAALFRDANIPKRLIPGTLALGAFSFTMTAMPRTPAIQNAIPMPFYGTTVFAAPGLGLIAGVIMFGLGMVWLNRRAAQAVAIGEGYGLHDDAMPKPDQKMREHAQGEGFDLDEISHEGTATGSLGDPSFAIAIAPIILVIVANLLFVQLVVPRMDTSYLALPMFGETSIEALRGVWSIIVALSLAILLLLATNWRRLGDVKRSLNHGADASVLPIFNTASLVGFGAVIAALPVFELITDAMLNLSDGNPLVSVAVSVGTLSALTGSASGGMSIALDSMIDTFLPMAAMTGTSLEVMHRVTSLASGALDCLPHNGAVITVLAICKLTHKDSYFDMLIVGAVIPFIEPPRVYRRVNLSKDKPYDTEKTNPEVYS